MLYLSPYHLQVLISAKFCEDIEIPWKWANSVALLKILHSAENCVPNSNNNNKQDKCAVKRADTSNKISGISGVLKMRQTEQKLLDLYDLHAWLAISSMVRTSLRQWPLVAAGLVFCCLCWHALMA